MDRELIEREKKRTSKERQESTLSATACDEPQHCIIILNIKRNFNIVTKEKITKQIMPLYFNPFANTMFQGKYGLTAIRSVE